MEEKPNAGEVRPQSLVLPVAMAVGLRLEPKTPVKKIVRTNKTPAGPAQAFLMPCVHRLAKRKKS